MAERTIRTGWFALYPESDPRLAFATLSARVGHSARAEISWVDPETDSGVYNGIDLEYMRSRATVTMFMCLDPLESWTREGSSTLPPELRTQMRALVDDSESDLNELFSLIATQDPGLIAAIDIDELDDIVPEGGDSPTGKDVWHPAPGTAVKTIDAWWS